MTMIATVTGKVIDFLNPDPAQLNLDDIAAGLKAMPRFTGQTIRPWSVLQHSLLVAELAAPENRLAALLHDATEAYIADASTPLKQAMREIINGLVTPRRSDYDYVEHRLWTAICARWDLSPDLPADVHEADTDALVIEAPRLQPKGWELPVWDHYRHRAVPAWGVDYFHQLLGMGPSDCRSRWILDVATELTKRRAALRLSGINLAERAKKRAEAKAEAKIAEKPAEKPAKKSKPAKQAQAAPESPGVKPIITPLIKPYNQVAVDQQAAIDQT